jgi:hypothetical protein
MKSHLFYCIALVFVCAFFGLPVSPAWAQPILFTEVAADLGINDALPYGCSVEWYDFDNDGDQDLNLGHRFGSEMYIYRNDGTTFTRLDNSIGLLTNWDAGYGAATDFDHDGDLDLFTRCYHNASPLLIYENGQFIDRTTQYGLPWETGNRGTMLLDYDRDGFMDILYGHVYSGFHLFHNVNGQSFVEVTEQSQLPPAAGFSELSECDYDLDGDVDLFATTVGGVDYFFENLGNGVFQDRTVAAGFSSACGQMDCRWGYFTSDKWPDLITQGTNKHTIWRNNGDGTFTQMNVHGTETDFATQWGAVYAVADYDMDGDLDFYVMRPGGCGDSQAPNQFFIQDSLNGLDIYFHDVAPAWGMNFLSNGSCNIADIDGDGDMDLTISSTQDPLRIFRNNTISTDFLEVHVVGPDGDLDRWHTRIEAYLHGTNTLAAVSELNRSNVGRNGFNNYFVLNASGHYDLRIYFANGTVMTPETDPSLSDIVPSQTGHLISVRMGASATPDHRMTATDFRLIAVYPNPFNSRTVIRYALSVDAHVNVVVFNVEGQKVADLVNRLMPSGTHEVAWNASSLPSGIYFARLESGRHLSTKKIVLMK